VEQDRHAARRGDLRDLLGEFRRVEVELALLEFEAEMTQQQPGPE
jgi:hypothetical protein